MKRHRTTLAPPGAFEQVRNTRLYGEREEQIAGASLRARGCPNPNRAVVTRKRVELANEREQSAHLARLQRAQTAMLEAQRAVRAAKDAGQDFAPLAVQARALRAEYLKLSGGVERRTVDVAQASDANKIKAV